MKAQGNTSVFLINPLAQLSYVFAYVLVLQGSRVEH